MPLSCFQGNVYSAASDVLMVGGQCDAIQLKLLAAGKLKQACSDIFTEVAQLVCTGWLKSR